MEEIQWEEPPDFALFVGSGTQPGRYMPFVAELKERPGEWAAVPDFGKPRTEGSARGLAQNIKNGKVRGFKKGEFESAVHKNKVWARYTGAVDDGDMPPDDVRPVRRSSGDREDAARIRAWARTHGHTVPDRGRLPQSILDAYEEAPDGRRRDHVRSV